MEVTQGMTMSQAVCARCFTEFMKQKHADEAAAEVAKAQAEATAPVKGAATKAMKAKAGAPLEGAAMKADDVSPSLVKDWIGHARSLKDWDDMLMIDQHMVLAKAIPKAMNALL